LILEKQFIAGIAEKIIFADQTTKSINYITSPEGLTAIEITANPGEREWYWVFTDHLGSITTLLRESDGQKFEMSFDAWGNRRDPATWVNYTTTFPDVVIDRGFTGHEHLDVFGLINMNGRVYDPLVGRMLSPDNFMQAPDYTQSFNRYSYCLNNPLTYTDPSGYWAGWDDLIVGGIGFTFGYVSHGLSTGDWGWNAVGAGAIGAGTFLLGYYSGGTTSANSIANTFATATVPEGVAYSGTAHAATVALGYSGRMVASSAISSVLPSASINVGNATLSVSPAFMIGSGGYSTGVNFQASYDVGDFTFGGAYGASYGKSGFTGNTGSEIRLSGFAGYDDGKFGIGLSTTKFWSGETSQRLGRLSLRHGKDFSFSYENDGTPFQLIGLAGGTDDYRTASVTVGIGDLTIGMLLFTGHRDYENEIPQEGYPNKMVGNPEINKYNAGILYAGYRNMRAGWNHDNIRHVFQNKFAHGIIYKQAWIPRKNWPNQPYLVYGANNPYTNW
jgi:RHS repeat-associated protein